MSLEGVKSCTAQARESRLIYVVYDGITNERGERETIPTLLEQASEGHQLWVVSLEKGDGIYRRGSVIRTQLAAHSIAWYPQGATKLPFFSQFFDKRKTSRAIKDLVESCEADGLSCDVIFVPSLGEEQR